MELAENCHVFADIGADHGRLSTVLLLQDESRFALVADISPLALEKARALLPDGAEETACWVDFTENNGIVSARATIEAQMDIAAGRTQGTGVFYE
jgi:tRNA A22 N-methylase